MATANPMFEEPAQSGDAEADDRDMSLLGELLSQKEKLALLKYAEQAEKKREQRRAKEEKQLENMEKGAALQEERSLLGALKNLEELGLKEKRRVALVQHGKTANYWKILTAWDGTAVKWASKTVRLWWSVGIFMSVRLITIFGMLRTAAGLTDSDTAEEWIANNVPPMDMNKVAIIGAFHSLFLVFYASQTYERYDAQWKIATGIQGRIYDICTMAINCFEQNNQGAAAAHRLFRHANAVHLLGFIGLNKACEFHIP